MTVELIRLLASVAEIAAAVVRPSAVAVVNNLPCIGTQNYAVEVFSSRRCIELVVIRAALEVVDVPKADRKHALQIIFVDEHTDNRATWSGAQKGNGIPENEIPIHAILGSPERTRTSDLRFRNAFAFHNRSSQF